MGHSEKGKRKKKEGNETLNLCSVREFSLFYKKGNNLVEDDLPQSIVIRSCVEQVISACTMQNRQKSLWTHAKCKRQLQQSRFQWSLCLKRCFFKALFPISSSKMKNELQPTRGTFSRNCQCKKIPRCLSKFFFSFWY